MVKFLSQEQNFVTFLIIQVVPKKKFRTNQAELTFECHGKLAFCAFSCCIERSVFNFSWNKLENIATFVLVLHICNSDVVTEGRLNPRNSLGCVGNLIDIAGTAHDLGRLFIWKKKLSSHSSGFGCGKFVFFWIFTPILKLLLCISEIFKHIKIRKLCFKLHAGMAWHL